MLAMQKSRVAQRPMGEAAGRFPIQDHPKRASRRRTSHLDRRNGLTSPRNFRLLLVESFVDGSRGLRKIQLPLTAFQSTLGTVRYLSLSASFASRGMPIIDALSMTRTREGSPSAGRPTTRERPSGTREASPFGSRALGPMRLILGRGVSLQYRRDGRLVRRPPLRMVGCRRSSPVRWCTNLWFVDPRLV